MTLTSLRPTERPKGTPNNGARTPTEGERYAAENEDCKNKGEDIESTVIEAMSH